MSTDASQWAWKVRGVSIAQKVILLSLADRANEEHICWPSMKRLMDDTGINNKRTLINNIRALEKMGLLVALRDNGFSNRYRLIGVQGREDTGGTIATGGHSAKGGKKASLGSSNIATSGKSATGSKSATGGSGKSATGVVAKLPPESKKNLKENLEENIYSGKSVCVSVSGEPVEEFVVDSIADSVVDPVGAVAEHVASAGRALEWANVDKAVEDFVESFVGYVNTTHPSLAPVATPKLLTQSAATVDKLMRLDGFSLETIQAAMRFAVRDDFWAKNALSLCGLRKKGPDGRTKFQKILAAMEHSVGRVASARTMQGPRAVTVAQQRAQERDVMAKMLLEDEDHGQLFDA